MPKKCGICQTVLTNNNCRNYEAIPYCLNCEDNIEKDKQPKKRKRRKNAKHNTHRGN